MEIRTVKFTPELAKEMLEAHQRFLDTAFDNEWSRQEYINLLEEIRQVKEDLEAKKYQED